MNTPDAAPAGVLQSRPPLRRATQGRMVAGVAGGVSDHLGVNVWAVRAGFVLLAMSGGAGVLAYGLLWVFVPQRDEAAPLELGRGVALSVAALALGLVFVAELVGWGGHGLWQLAVVGCGAALVWLRVDQDQRARLLAGVEQRPSGWSGVWQVGIGVVLVVAGGLGFIAGRGGLAQAGQVLTASVVIVLGLTVLLAPYVIRVWRDRDAERRARIRVEERAEIAAHVHDSVLQTLTLIQRQSGDPREVNRLARAGERDLRHWLYAPPGTSDTSFRTALERAAGEVEDAHDVSIDVVCVGDLVLGDDRWSALLLAAREAMVNAAKYAGSAAPIAVYAEVGDDVVVFVRDRGPGFDLAAVPDDRMGVRQSILGRMERIGGSAVVRSDSDGTEVRFSVGRAGEPRP